MTRYKSTTKRRYMWGIGVVCSLLLLAISCSWAIEGRIGIRIRFFSGESVSEVRKDEAPGRFWPIAGFAVVASIVCTIITGIGFSRVQRDEDKPA